MGGGAWTAQASSSYYVSRGISADAINSRTVNQFYTSSHLNKMLDPRNVMRECRDSDEHPNTIPVILALDVTGSMGSALAAVASKINEIMTSVLDTHKNVEFCVMGIGDLAYDDAPIQISQYESDIRILESLDKIYFERGGGGNGYESYTAAWYMGLYHTDLDCWKRGKKGIIITMGDEPLNPYLPKNIQKITGDDGDKCTDTKELYRLASEKFDIYHIEITDSSSASSYYHQRIVNSFGKVLGQHLLHGNSNKLPELITNIIDDAESSNNNTVVNVSSNGGISW